MTDPANAPERRLDRRIPIGCSAVIRPLSGETIPAACIELSVSGMTLHAAYVPHQLERLQVAVLQPGANPALAPLTAEVEVRRCHSIGGGEYEIGVSIVRVTH